MSIIARVAYHTRDVLGTPAPPADGKPNCGQGFGAGSSLRAEAQDCDTPVMRQGRAFRGPNTVLDLDMRVHPQVMSQNMARDPFHHSLGQVGVDHPHQRVGQCGISDNPFDTSPQAEDRFAPAERCEIG